MTTRPDDRSPERDFPETAFLLSAWSDATRSSGDGTPAELDELDEELLGLLDGTLSGEDAARARRRLTEDPALARAFGELRAALEDVPDLAATPPSELLREVRAAGVPSSRSQDPGIFRRMRELLASPTPALLGAAAATLLVALVLRESTPERGAELRTNPHASASAQQIERITPKEDENLRGDVRFAWGPVAGARSYHVVLVDVAGTTVAELGPTEEASWLLPGAEISQRFGEGAHELHWIVRARREDGSEVSSAPGRFEWSAVTP
ncbi:MAG: hypothetical protein R3B81_00260 [bacterium]